MEATNYLGPIAKLDPLLHPWSLGVEEQFYLAWPLLLLGGLMPAQLSYALIEHPVRTAPLLRHKPPNYAMLLAIAGVSIAIIHWTDASARREANSPRFVNLMAARNDVPLLYALDCDRWFQDATLLECIGGRPDGR